MKKLQNSKETSQKFWYCTHNLAFSIFPRYWILRSSFPLVFAYPEFLQSLTAGSVTACASRKCRRFSVTLPESRSPEQRGSPALYQQIRQEHVECKWLLAASLARSSVQLRVCGIDWAASVPLNLDFSLMSLNRANYFPNEAYAICLRSGIYLW